MTSGLFFSFREIKTAIGGGEHEDRSLSNDVSNVACIAMQELILFSKMSAVGELASH